MTVYVSNKQVSSRQAYIYTLIYIGDQGIVYLFVGFLSLMERFLGTMSKNSGPVLLYYMTEGWRLLR